MQTEPILAETTAGILRTLGTDLDRIVIERAVIGLFFTGVKLNTGVAGACATPLRSIPEAVCCPSSAMAMPFPNKLRGRLARDLLKETAALSGIRRAVGIATMNALADMCWERRATPEVELRAGVDAYDAADIQAGEHVVVVGAFVPFLKALKRSGQPFTVLEMDPATLKPDELTHFRPAGRPRRSCRGRCRADHRHHAAERHDRAAARTVPPGGACGNGRSNGRSIPRCVPASRRRCTRRRSADKVVLVRKPMALVSSAA